ncbi:MAG: helix-turn-helix transcriptional regulator [Negativicutes bacterium]|nr:helix-turn-helix transcriptional regulator [Negativicutes bacterium]
MALTPRQEKIAEIVRLNGPITGDQIAERLNVTRAALRPDLTVLIMSGIIDARPKVGYYYTGKGALNLIADEIQNIKVRDVQSVPVVVTTGTKAYDAIVTMFLEDVGTIFVIDEGSQLAGVVSRKDLLKVAMGGADLQKLPVKVLMTAVPKVIVTTPEEPVLSAAKKLIENEVDSLPVVRSIAGTDAKSREVVGRLTKTNITRLFVDLAEGKGGNCYR